MTEKKDLVHTEGGGYMPVDQEAQSQAVMQMQGERAIAEVQAQVVMAKRFPRDQHVAIERIKTACERLPLAEVAIYSYSRGGSLISGASIRLAEVMAQAWGNLDFGVREVSQTSAGDGVSEMEAYAWDIETNVRQTKRFHVPHVRWTRQHGKRPVRDPRDVYEVVANQGARRLRACILGIIPKDIQDIAVAVCRGTVKRGDGKPMVDRIRRVVANLGAVGVPKEAMEARLDHSVDLMTQDELVDYGEIYTSIKGGAARREEFFDLKGSAAHGASAVALNEKFVPDPSLDPLPDEEA